MNSFLEMPGKEFTRIQDGHKDPIEFVKNALVQLRIVDYLTNHVSYGGGRDPFSSVNTCQKNANQICSYRYLVSKCVKEK